MKQFDKRAAELYGYTGITWYVRCRYCDRAYSDESEISWNEVHKQEPRCEYKEANFVCSSCGIESDSFIFPNI